MEIVQIIHAPPVLIAKRRWGIYQVTAHYSDGHVNSKSYECFTPTEATRKYLMEFGRVMGKIETNFQKPLDKQEKMWYNNGTKEREGIFMKVYVVMSVCDYEYGNTEIVGIFSTKEKAKECIEQLGGQRTWVYWDGRTYNQYSIDEWEVDQND